MITGHASRLKKIRALALLLVVLSVLVVLVSSYIRLDNAGIDCANWPACYGRMLVSDLTAPQVSFARIFHRVTASVALLLAGFLAWYSWRPQPIQPVSRYAAWLLLLMLLLAVLGIFSADPRRVTVGFLNIVGGLGLVMFSWRIVLACKLTPQPQSEYFGPRTILLRLGALALSITVMLGAWIGASYTAASCLSVPDCAGIWWPTSKDMAALNPFIKLQSVALPGDPGGVFLNLLHRYSAGITFVLLGLAGMRALAKKSGGRNLEKIVLFLLVVELALGVATVVSGLNLWLTIGHGIGAAVLLGAVASVLRR